MTQKVLLLLKIVCLFSLPCLAQANTEIVNELTQSIAAAKTEQEKSRLYMFRARNYNNIGEFERAEQDYDRALQYDHKGWIHLERARFYLKQGNHEQARAEAIAAEKETPTLKRQAEKILAVAHEAAEEEYKEEKPAVILLNKRWRATYTKTPAKPVKKYKSGSSYAKKTISRKKTVRKRGRS